MTAASHQYIRGRPAALASSRLRKISSKNAFLRSPRLPLRRTLLSSSSLRLSGGLWLLDIGHSRKLRCGAVDVGQALTIQLRSSYSQMTRSLVSKCPQKELLDLNFSPVIGCKRKDLSGQSCSRLTCIQGSKSAIGKELVPDLIKN
jgi:hypothetical protein